MCRRCRRGQKGEIRVARWIPASSAMPPQLSSADYLGVMQVGVVDRIVPPLDRVIVLEPILDVRLDVAVILGGDVEGLAVGVLADVALLDDQAAGLDDVAR